MINPTVFALGNEHLVRFTYYMCNKKKKNCVKISSLVQLTQLQLQLMSGCEHTTGQMQLM